MPARSLRSGFACAITLAIVGCVGGSRHNTREAPIPGGDPKPPPPSWISKFLGLDRPIEPVKRPAKHTSDTDLTVDPFFPGGPNAPKTEFVRQPLTLDIQAPPTVVSGQDVPVRVTLRNTSATALSAASLSQQVPDSCQLLRSDPPATLQGNRLVWNLPAIPAGASQDVTVIYRPARPGVVALRADAQSTGDVAGSAQASVDVQGAESVGTRPAPAQLVLQVRGPQETSLGSTVTYDVSLTNPAQAAVSRVSLSAELDPGLDHESGARRLEIPIPMMAAGETKSVQLPLTVHAAGQLHLVLTATGEGAATRRECTLEVQATRLEVGLTGPDRVMVGQPATWNVRVVNPGAGTAENVVVRVQLPAELTYRAATMGGQIDRGQVVWQLGRLNSREERNVQFTAIANRLLDRTSMIATATADRTPEVRADRSVEVFGSPVLKASIRGSESAVEVGNRVIYAVELRNAGAVPVRDVNVAVNFADQLKPLFGAGPTVVRIEGTRVSCGRVSEIAPGDAVMFRIEAEGFVAGDARVMVEATSAGGEPQSQSETTRVAPKR
ncbi:MAG: hypothetical protein ACJ8C4_17375 [Gemmataceae bacterium]